MFGIGPLELAIIVVVAIVFIGPKRLPIVMRQFGKTFVQIRRYTNEFRNGFNDIINEAERDLAREEVAKLKAQLEEATRQIDVKSIVRDAEQEYVNTKAHAETAAHDQATAAASTEKPTSSPEKSTSNS